MFFTVEKKRLSESMSHFNKTPEFEKELSRLSKKYKSLHKDIADLEDVIRIFPTGSGKNFKILHSSKIKIIKTRLACTSLRERSMRVIYAYRDDTVTFVYIEIYFKGDKENEDKERIDVYLRRVNESES